MLSKKENIEKGIWQTTHLVCSRAEGVKYNAAKKWKLPVVTKDWLLCCLNAAAKLPVDNYRVAEGMTFFLNILFQLMFSFPTLLCQSDLTLTKSKLDTNVFV